MVRVFEEMDQTHSDRGATGAPETNAETGSNERRNRASGSQSAKAMSQSLYFGPSTVFQKYDDVCRVAFGLGPGATRCFPHGHKHTRHGSVTEEQQRPKPKAAQLFGRRRFSSQTSLLAPYRPLAGMLVARASSGSKIPCRKRYRIFETQYLACQFRNERNGLRACSKKIQFCLNGAKIPGRAKPEQARL